MEKKTIVKIICVVVIVAVATLLLSGLLNGDTMYHLQNRGDLGPLTREDLNLVTVAAPAATSKDGTINAQDWSETFPYIAMTMKANADNAEAEDYLEQDPYLVNIYEGYGFAKDYKAARGHEFTLEDVAKTARPHANANCLTCKSPNFAKLVQEQGEGVYTMKFDEILPLMEENISCYTCHGNNAGNKGELTVTHTYVNKALGQNVYNGTIDPSTLSCGQCHIEYYFVPGYNAEEQKITYTETMMPYSSVETMTPGAILEYYNTLQMPDGTVGFYDWIQPSTGTRMLKAQHPEMETYLSSKHAAAGLNCADCHMAMEMADDGTVYHSHELVSPLDNETLLANCASCHGDANMVQAVHRIQEQVTTRETEVGNKLSALKDALAAAVEAGQLPETQLDQVRSTYRAAQWYFDFCYVENSEGFHNAQLANECLDTADGLIDEAMALLAR